MIPEYAKDSRKEQFLLNIHYKPTTAIFRGQEITVRLDEASFSKKMQIYGIEGVSEDIECMIILSEEDDQPESRKDTLLIDSARYDITEVSQDPGSSCYNLTLRKGREVK